MNKMKGNKKNNIKKKSNNIKNITKKYSQIHNQIKDNSKNNNFKIQSLNNKRNFSVQNNNYNFGQQIHSARRNNNNPMFSVLENQIENKKNNINFIKNNNKKPQAQNSMPFKNKNKRNEVISRIIKEINYNIIIDQKNKNRNTKEKIVKKQNKNDNLENNIFKGKNNNNKNELEKQKKQNEEQKNKNQAHINSNNIQNNKQINNKILIEKEDYEKLKLENQILINKNEELQKELDSLKDFKEIYELEIKKNPMIIYKVPTLVGLNNIGATCFMNATLECLSQTKNLTNYFLNKNNLNNIINNNIALENENKNQLSPVYLELIQNLWKKDGPKAFDPTNFMNKINDMNSLFKKGQPGDSKDFIIYILEQLHKELKKPIKINNINNISEEEVLDQYDKNNTFKHFFNDFQKDCSIISDLFFRIIETNNECLNCKNNFSAKGINNPICYNYQIFNCLIFPLAEVYNMKINVINSNNIIMNSNSVTLNDCFCYYTSTHCFNGENRNFCNICHQLSDSFYTTRIYSSPNVLIIILNRGKDNIYNIKLDFGEIIDITQFVLEKDMPEIRYELYGVITHIGESGPNAHFIASCKSPINKKWYRYNDAFVDPITNIQNEILDYGIPYILFYQKKDY